MEQKRYRAGQKIDDLCRACKLVRVHTVFATGPDGEAAACRVRLLRQPAQLPWRRPAGNEHEHRREARSLGGRPVRPGQRTREE